MVTPWCFRLVLCDTALLASRALLPIALAAWLDALWE